MELLVMVMMVEGRLEVFPAETKVRLEVAQVESS
jgi:hypothetical protein